MSDDAIFIGQVFAGVAAMAFMVGCAVFLLTAPGVQ